MQIIDDLRSVIRLHHYSIHTENSYIDRVRRFILFHKGRHPSEMGAVEINRL